MPASPNLFLPYIQPSQAQKHVTHNEGMRLLDAVVQLSLASATMTTPPAVPAQGDRYVLPVGASGAWFGHSRELAVFEDSAWTFHSAKTGWLAWTEDNKELIAFDGTDWIKAVSPPEFQNLPQVGVGTAANAANPLAAAGPATLLTHAGAGHQLKLNKATETDTASLLYQTNWSGRAEIGTTGSDDFEIKVSADGAAFKQALLANKDTGKVSFPSGTSGLAPADFGETPLVTTDYITAKGENLIANSTGLLGNGYNYPAALTHDPATAPNLPASFCFSGHYPGSISMSERIAVDPNQVYRLNSYLRQEGLPGDWSAFPNGERHSQYMGLLCYDRDGNIISAQHHMRYKHAGTESLTTLTADLTPGDTTIQVADAAGWNESSAAASNRGVILLGYKNSHGYAYDHYSRLVGFDLFNLGQVDKSTDTITLNTPFPTTLGNPDHSSGTWPAGTRIANSATGGSYKYAFYQDLHLPQNDTWYQTTGYIGGIDTSGTNAPLNFPPGTTFARTLWLPNYSNRNGGGFGAHPDTGPNHKVWFTGVSVRSDPLATQQAVTSGSATGAKDIKVPQTDHSTGTITLVPADQSVMEL